MHMLLKDYAIPVPYDMMCKYIQMLLADYHYRL